jgi:uncharacterized protein YigE (DUF2233 family)
MRAALLLLLAMNLLSGSLYAAECAPFTYHNVSATICHIDIRQERLRLFHRDEKDRPLKYFSGVNRLLQSEGEQLAFGMNAGMYHSDYSAVGLLVIDGIEQQPINLESASGNFFLKPNGVFLVSDRGARIVDSTLYSQVAERVELATQSGPLLVIDGTIHPAFRKHSTSRNVRNGVGVLSRHEVVFAISEEPVNFHEFALLFRNGLGCKDALFLDATVSSLYSKNLGRADVRASLGPIIGVTEPLSSTEE